MPEPEQKPERESCNHCRAMYPKTETVHVTLGKDRGLGRTGMLTTVRLCRRCAAEIASTIVQRLANS